MLNHSITLEIRNLAQELCQFGLNPQDWRLIRENDLRYRIESLSDEDFIFIGQVQKREGKPMWAQISLAQI